MGYRDQHKIFYRDYHESLFPSIELRFCVGWKRTPNRLIELALLYCGLIGFRVYGVGFMV